VTASDTDIAIFLRSLRRESGGYADNLDGEAGLRSTLSVIKALAELGEGSGDSPAEDFIRSCRNPDGSFSIKPGADATPFDTADGLVALHALGAPAPTPDDLDAAIAYMRAHATTQFDHFMVVASFEECEIAAPVPTATVDFFETRLPDALAGGRVVDTAIAAASLIRAGRTLADPGGVARLLRSGQDPASGGFGDGGAVSLFATYCAMRTLALLGELPDTRSLLAYVGSLATDRGYTDTPGSHTTAGATYMVLSMLAWVRGLQAGPVRAARDGDVDALRAWLAGGGEPNLRDRDGWTPLLAAASHGRAAAVELLLHPEIPGAPPADPALRYEAADALPVYLAAHAGDLETVRLLLAAAPDHLHERSSVNGHTALLQAAFYGKQRHLVLAEYLLDHAAAIRGLAPDEAPEEQVRLLSATNVRGYNALGMQDLWHNQAMKDLLLRYHGGSPDSERGREIERRRVAYVRSLLLSIATPQALIEQVLAAVGDYLAADDPTASGQHIDEILLMPGFDINRLGGELGMPPLVYAITGVDVGNPARAERRRALAEKLLAAGADPAVRERHPMAVGAVIRASVLNNFGLLQLIADHMPAAAFAAEMNVSPAVNGLTAMHDAIHRALTSPPEELGGHLAQITWMIRRGARLDLPDNTGQTQRDLVAAALDDPAFPAENVAAVAAAVKAAQASASDAPAS
jgi:hypothetical protein